MVPAILVSHPLFSKSDPFHSANPVKKTLKFPVFCVGFRFGWLGPIHSHPRFVTFLKRRRPKWVKAGDIFHQVIDYQPVVRSENMS
jgi:hypothetical protein